MFDLPLPYPLHKNIFFSPKFVFSYEVAEKKTQGEKPPRVMKNWFI